TKARQVYITNDQKRQLVAKYKEGGLTQGEVCEWGRITFGLSGPINQTSLSRYVKKHKDLNNMTSAELSSKRVNDVANKPLDEKLATWVLNCERMGAALTGNIITRKGQQLAETMGSAPTFSHGWLHKFVNRHKLKNVKLHGESGSVDTA
ncbi:hypothetical protein BGW39_004381, partial [Mortierella sp. 14UC]